MSQFQQWSEVFHNLLVPIFGYAAYILRGIRNELREMNSRVVTLETWRGEHDKADDGRFDALTDDIHRIQDRFDRAGVRR